MGGAPDGWKSRFRQPNLRNFSGEDPRTPLRTRGEKTPPEPPYSIFRFFAIFALSCLDVTLLAKISEDLFGLSLEYPSCR